MSDQDAIVLAACAVWSAPEPVNEYLRAILTAAARANFLLKYIEPAFGQEGGFLFMISATVFRAGTRSPDRLVALVTACNAVRAELEARGHRLPERIDVE